jgi:putative restriction endonuclease
MVDLTQLFIGHEYDRPTLARLWGYRSYNAISRGVFTPRDQDIIVFFVTNEKQEALTQYEDRIDADVLFWEGEQGHGSDARITAGRDSIHVFYRERHHSPFVYEGRALLRSHLLRHDGPSKFTFQLIDRKKDIPDIVAEIQTGYGIPTTEREAIIRSRVGQGLYRERALGLWGTCSVSGFTKQPVLVASHIKPWKFCSNDERLNPFNSLVLVPTLDKLFDKGYIGFEKNGNIMLSSKICQEDWARVGIDCRSRLRNVPDDTKTFLVYHGEYIYDLCPE